jgi:hypothetical protein
MIDIRWKVILLLISGYYDVVSLIEFTDTSEFKDAVDEANSILKEHNIN